MQKIVGLRYNSASNPLKIEHKEPLSAEDRAQRLWALGQEKRARGQIIDKLERGEELSPDEAALHGEATALDPTLREVALAVAATAFKNLQNGASTPEEAEQMVREIIETLTSGD